ncbi:hypothetical protein [Sphaerisporangium perillae]|uniref:hypothetical protein n=1 Tax=Sphaerisporangium perillae TaxID=2935860 RepID=UPI0020103013|nr:hypothetical protein [Sphaerisporangium perillae]
MRRWIALTATAMVAPALAMAAPAAAHAAPGTANATLTAPQAAPGNPVEALRQQFAKKSGVRLDELTRMRLDGEDLLKYRQVGNLRFGKSGVDALDVKIVLKGDGKVPDSTLRTIVIDGKTYLRSALYDDLLPAGRSWVRAEGGTPTLSTIDVLQPKVLKTILASTKSKSPGGKVGGARTTLLRGSVTLANLAKVSPSLASLAKSLKSKKPVALPWKLWIGGDQLPRRFQSSLPISASSLTGKLTIDTDSRYTSWGKKVVITAPPATEVVDEEDLQTDLPVTPDLTFPVTGLTARQH